MSAFVVVKTTAPLGHLRDLMSFSKVHLQPVRPDVPLVAALHRADVLGLLPPRTYTVLGLEMTRHVSDSVNACQHRSAVVWAGDHVLGTTAC